MPYLAGPSLLFIIIFYQRGSHIHAESVASVREPETHHIFNSLPGSNSGSVTKTLLPWFGDLVETVIESRLTFKEVQNIAAASLAFSSYIRKTIRCLKAEIRPDKAVGIFVFLSLLAFTEPWVFL